MISRRQALAGGGLLIVGVLPIRRGRAATQQPGATEKELIFRSTEPRNAEPKLSDLIQSWITPTKFFYIRSHAPNPRIDPQQYRLKIDGMVDRVTELRLEDLQRYPERTITATLTCAGNRRAEFNQQAPVGGVQWEAGAIGNATWTGVALADVLNDVGVADQARHVWLEGLDAVPHGEGTIPFGASIPIEKAIDADDGLGALLVTKMNGEPLSEDHGFPLRAIVPGYIGARSVKWLGRVSLAEHPSPNHYVAEAYKVVTDTSPLAWAEAGPIYRYPINAAIGKPEAGMTVPAGPLEVAGYVLPSGKRDSRVREVWVSADGGRGWVMAELVGEELPYCWRLWRAEVEVTPETKELICRASDSTGEFMPPRIAWNAKGYLQNSWFRLPINVQ
ncbi:MAG: sulfite oxidase [Pirellulaceae bacterium]|nr:MAG: sulfite oxidase [Pirellulaceae bacterium]